jgi:hypothetical protein
MSQDLDQLLRHQGTRYHDLADRTSGDLHDVNTRTGHQRRRRRAAAGSVLTVAVVVIVLAVNRQPVTSTLQSGGTEPAPTIEPTTATDVATSSIPSTTVASSTSTVASSSTTTPRPAGPDIRTVDFKNRTYPADTCAMGTYEAPAEGYPLRDGVWNGATFDLVSIEQDPVYGDVTGDGREDAVVTILCSTGVGSSNRRHPWVYTPDATAPGGIRRLTLPRLTEGEVAQVGLPPDSYTRGGGASIANGVLTIEWTTWTPEDTAMWPSKFVTTHQRWNGTAWQTTSPPTVRDNPRPPGA